MHRHYIEQNIQEERKLYIVNVVVRETVIDAHEGQKKQVHMLKSIREFVGEEDREEAHKGENKEEPKGLEARLRN
jgi:hypothetical protein